MRKCETKTLDGIKRGYAEPFHISFHRLSVEIRFPSEDRIKPLLLSFTDHSTFLQVDQTLEKMRGRTRHLAFLPLAAVLLAMGALPAHGAPTGPTPRPPPKTVEYIDIASSSSDEERAEAASDRVQGGPSEGVTFPPLPLPPHLQYGAPGMPPYPGAPAATARTTATAPGTAQTAYDAPATAPPPPPQPASAPLDATDPTHSRAQTPIVSPIAGPSGTGRPNQGAYELSDESVDGPNILNRVYQTGYRSDTLENSRFDEDAASPLHTASPLPTSLATNQTPEAFVANAANNKLAENPKMSLPSDFERTPGATEFENSPTTSTGSKNPTGTGSKSSKTLVNNAPSISESEESVVEVPQEPPAGTATQRAAAQQPLQGPSGTDRPGPSTEPQNPETAAALARLRKRCPGLSVKHQPGTMCGSLIEVSRFYSTRKI